MKKILLLGAIAILAVACGNKAKTENENAKTEQNSEYTQYLDSLKADNNLKITMGKVPVTIVGKELKVGDKIKAVSDFKYHQFGLQNGFFVKEKGLLTRALTILDENNTVKYIEYVPEEGKEANIDKALKFLENNLIKK